jgi:PKD repeat protein
VKKPLSVPAPVAAFSADDTTPNVGQTVVLTDASTNTPTSWVWTIEGTIGTDYEYVDSTTSASKNPHVKFLVAGTYDVTLVATNSAGNDDEVKADYITVTAPPVPTIEVTLGDTSVSLSPMIAGQDATGSTTVTVSVENSNNWDVTASDGKTPNKGYMVSGTTPLAKPFELGKNSAAYLPLTSDYTDFMTGTTSGDTATASLRQPVVSEDAVGDYGITVTFTGACS